ncbi:MAG: hypothetical protein Fur0024_1940 [Patescibacteria group bacterium]
MVNSNEKNGGANPLIDEVTKSPAGAGGCTDAVYNDLERFPKIPEGGVKVTLNEGAAQKKGTAQPKS